MKDTIRETVKSRRDSMSKYEIEERSSAIVKKLLDFDILNVNQSIFFYINFGSEVETLSTIEKLTALGFRILVPRVDWVNKRMEIYPFDSVENLVKSKYGILEPVKDTENQIDYSEIDVCITPGVAFDRQKNRIGYGGGFYDKFFSFNKAATRIALAFDMQLVDQIETDLHDEKVDMIITETAIYA